jgi:hypothetical protein
MLRKGAAYAHTALRHLPDFFAIRDMRRFDNAPEASGTRHKKVKIQLHWIGEFKDQIVYRNGAEILDDSDASELSPTQTTHAGLLSEGEFGPGICEVRVTEGGMFLATKPAGANKNPRDFRPDRENKWIACPRAGWLGV